MKSDPFDQVMGFLPYRLREAAERIQGERRSKAEEIRLRAGYPLSVVLGEREYAPAPDRRVSGEELQTVLELASEHSVHTVMERLRDGYVTVSGGHRLGLCGEAVVEQGKITGLRRLSSLNLRIAREIKGAARGLLPRLKEGDRLLNTLIIARPGAGKTTLLRDLVRRISTGEETPGRRVGVVDERGELAALCGGQPQMDLGPRTDVLDGAPKGEGMLLMLRGMNPQVLAVDEITHPEDIIAITHAVGCGVTVIATIHGEDREDLFLRPACRELMERHMFRRAVQIVRGADGERGWKVEEIK